MAAPYEYTGRGDTCMGCVDVIAAGEMVAPMSDDRPERLLCVACWWLVECELPLRAWARGTRWPAADR